MPTRLASNSEISWLCLPGVSIKGCTTTTTWPFKVVNFMVYFKVHEFHLYFSKKTNMHKKEEQKRPSGASGAGRRSGARCSWPPGSTCAPDRCPRCPHTDVPVSVKASILPQCHSHRMQDRLGRLQLYTHLSGTWHSPETALPQAETVRTLTAGPPDHGRDWPPL